MSMNHPPSWTEQVRREARIAVEIAANRSAACERTLAYFLRCAIAHGLTVEECCKAGNLDRETVMRLTDPAVA
ncbi:MAG: hypothetical protein ACXVGF_04620 [Blastococcus sp.]